METFSFPSLTTPGPTAAATLSASPAGTVDVQALMAMLGATAASTDDPFASLLGERLSELSPEVLQQVQQVLQTAEGEPLPEDGNELPPDALLALLAGGGLPTPVSGEVEEGQPGRGGLPEGRLAGVAGLQLASVTLPDALPETVTAEDAPFATHLAQPASHTQPGGVVATPAPAVDVPVGRPGWDQAVGQRVVWLVNQHEQAAEIQLNPKELGPVEVRIRMEGDQVHLSLGALHGTTREALEQALPRLREMFAEAGLSLASADVGQHGAGRDAQTGTGGGQAGAAQPSGEFVDGGETLAAPARVGQGLLDAYA